MRGTLFFPIYPPPIKRGVGQFLSNWFVRNCKHAHSTRTLRARFRLTNTLAGIPSGPERTLNRYRHSGWIFSRLSSRTLPPYLLDSII